MSNTQITAATNLTGPDIGSARGTSSQKFFNNLYSKEFFIGPANDVIVAYFEQYADNPTTGRNIAATVIYTALAQNLDPMMVLEQFKTVPKKELTSYLTAFLNSNRAPTSVLGLKDSKTVNPYVQRCILP